MHFSIEETGGLGDGQILMFAFLRVLAPAGNESRIKSIPVDDSLLLDDVPSDDPERSSPVAAGSRQRRLVFPAGSNWVGRVR